MTFFNDSKKVLKCYFNLVIITNILIIIIITLIINPIQKTGLYLSLSSSEGLIW